jgi:hypothetical protein
MLAEPVAVASGEAKKATPAAKRNELITASETNRREIRDALTKRNLDMTSILPTGPLRDLCESTATGFAVIAGVLLAPLKGFLQIDTLSENTAP